MRVVSLNKLKLGNVLAKSVITAQGKVLLKDGSVINSLYLNKLKEISIKNVYIQDEQYNDIQSYDIISIDTRVLLYKALENIFQAINKNIDFDDNAICGTVKLFCEDFQSVDFQASNFGIDICDKNRLIEHSINVCILSLLIGNSMGTYNYSKLYDLALGAILHDIGRTDMEENDKNHAEKAFNVLRKHQSISLNSSIVAYEHHENIDGTGYPRCIKGNNITEFSRIVAVADAFDILMHTGNNKLKPITVVAEMLKMAGHNIDREMTEVLLKNVVLYPNGVSVKLDNGQTGVVVKQNKNTSLKPVVRCNISDKLTDIDLSIDNTINIIEIINYI